MSTLTEKSIGELLTEKFHIPLYQRGYRWTEQQVTDLLNDIDEFTPRIIDNTDDKTWYCLQPVVVKKSNDNEWEVIDGQQRLTTTYLILHYLNQGYIESRRKKLFELRYKNLGIDVFQKLDENNIDDTTVDRYFITTAYKTICDWFRGKDSRFDVNNFESKFIHNTKVIWFETSNENPVDIFTRINSGKIPLTNAELIKALFLNSSNFSNYDTEKIRLKQLEIASQWDSIEYALQDDAFWYFINDKKNNLDSRIEFIFNLMYSMAKEYFNLKKTNSQLNFDEKYGVDNYATFRYFARKFKKNENIDDIWKEIKNYFQTLEEWFNDRELYHKIGFLISTGTNIKSLFKEKETKTKCEFLYLLNSNIANKVNADLDGLEYGNKDVKKILLLHNIQTMLNNELENSRFPFDRYKKESWDVEHIHANATQVKVNKDNLIEWLESNYIVNDEQNELDIKIQQIKDSKIISKDEDIVEIINYVLGEEDNTLQNLCILDSSTNRSYKNDSFKVKRSKIIEREKAGTFIPIGTKNAFMKYYTNDVNDIKVWNKQDRNSYLEEIKSVISPYTLTKLEENE